MALFTFHEPTKRFAMMNPAIFWIAMAVLLVTMISMACCEGVRRKTPMNFIFLGLFTLAQSFLLGVTASRYAPNEVCFQNYDYINIKASSDIIVLIFVVSNVGLIGSWYHGCCLSGSYAFRHTNQIWLYGVRWSFGGCNGRLSNIWHSGNFPAR